MQGADPLTGKMPVPQVLFLKGQHYSLHSSIIDSIENVKSIIPNTNDFS
jgi:hypothetical protein